MLFRNPQKSRQLHCVAGRAARMNAQKNFLIYQCDTSAANCRCKISSDVHRGGLPILLSDGGGLYLRKQTRAGASWTLRFTFVSREHWITLGNYPDMTLAQACVEARQARVQLDRQQNPLSLRRAVQDELRQQISFAQLCEDWFKSEIARRPLKHPDVPRRYLN
jgi:hypothetical protein